MQSVGCGPCSVPVPSIFKELLHGTAAAQLVLQLLQGGDMAAEYAMKMAALHEESAARAEADLRKRCERYALLAKLQAQAQVSALVVWSSRATSLL